MGGKKKKPEERVEEQDRELVIVHERDDGRIRTYSPYDGEWKVVSIYFERSLELSDAAYRGSIETDFDLKKTGRKFEVPVFEATFLEENDDDDDDDGDGTASRAKEVTHDSN
jgi:hypothetical protein